MNSDEELDPYKESLKRDVANRDKAAASSNGGAAGGLSESDSEDGINVLKFYKKILLS